MRSAAVQRAWELFNLRRLDEAMRAAIRASGEEPQDYEPHYIISLCHTNQGRYDEGREAAAEVLRLDPEQAAGHHAMGFSWLHQARDSGYDWWCRVDLDREPPERLKDACRCYAEAIRLNPDWSMLWRLRSEALLLDRQYTQAEEAARRAVALAPRDTDAYLALFMALRQQGRQGEAEVLVNDALRVHPDEADLHAALGWACFDLGRKDEATRYFREALRIDPENWMGELGLLEAMKSKYVAYRVYLKARRAIDGDSLIGLILLLIFDLASELLLLMDPLGRVLLDKWQRYYCTIAAAVGLPLVGAILLWLVSFLVGNYEATPRVIALRLLSFTLIGPALAAWAGLSVTRWWWAGYAIGVCSLLGWLAAILVPGLGYAAAGSLWVWACVVAAAFGGWSLVSNA